MTHKNYDVIIIGGSYAGLSAAMALGRALRNVLIIDSGNPCNKQTPHSHNFITHDGETPATISKKAKEQVLTYGTVNFVEDTVVKAAKSKDGFEIETGNGNTFQTSKILIATGIKDILPAINGFKECWGISILHCPYCHGYEVKHQTTGILMNSDMAFEFAKLIHNWTSDLTVFTNGKSALTEEQTQKLLSKNIAINEKEIREIEHQNGNLTGLIFNDHSKHFLKALYAKPVNKQHSDIAEQLGCELTEQFHIKVDAFQKTTVYGVYAAGDCTTPLRALSKAVSEGMVAGALLNKEMTDDNF